MLKIFQLASFQICLISVLFLTNFGFAQDTSLIAYYPFNGNAQDSSGYGNHGAGIGGVVPTTDRFGSDNSAMHFNGSDGYIIISNSPSLQTPTNGLTIAGWINIEGFPSIAVAGMVMKTISNMQGEYGLGYAESPDGNIYYIQNGISPGYGSVNLNLNRWHFMAATFNSDLVKIYCDGILLSSTQFSSPIVPDNNPLVLGLETNGAAEYFQGKLDDIRIYNRSLSYQEIDSLYHEGGWASGDLVAYYPFNGNTNDESGYGNHGTAYGGGLYLDRFFNQNSAYSFSGFGNHMDCGDPPSNILDLGPEATIIT
jgi:hypothetical protein